MTQTPEATDLKFKAEFTQVDVLIGGTTLSMTLAFDAAGQVGTVSATGPARLTRGSTNPPLNLEFPMVGHLRYNPTEPISPMQYTLSLHSDFPDHRLGLSLSVELTAASDTPPWQLEELEFTGEYTWLQGEPVTVKDAKFRMTPLLGD